MNDTPNCLTISDSLLVIDGHHTKLVTGKDFVGFMAMDPDSDSDTPLITDVLWTESWHRESGGPVSWDGGTTVGFAGPFVLAEIPSGDVFDEPSVWSIPENFLPQEYILMDLQSHENSVTAILLGAIGLPDLPGDAYNNWLNKDFDGDGHAVYVNLPEHRIRQVIDALCAASPHYKRIVEALRDSSTPLGKKVYETFESVLERTDDMWSILHVLNGADENP